MPPSVAIGLLENTSTALADDFTDPLLQLHSALERVPDPSPIARDPAFVAAMCRRAGVDVGEAKRQVLAERA